MLVLFKKAGMAKTRGHSKRGVDGRPGRRCEMIDDSYRHIEDLLPVQRRGGRRAKRRTVLNGIF